MDKLKLFLVVAVIQLLVPAYMIYQKEGVLKDGRLYRLKTAPVDPHDPFRGKYVTLSFEERSIVVYDTTWEVGQDVYVKFGEWGEGYAYPSQVYKELPEEGFFYCPAAIDYMTNDNGKVELFLTYPFDRYYMEESKAKEAERLYRSSTNSNDDMVYAEIKVGRGKAVLEAVKVNNVLLEDAVLEERKKKKD